MDSNQNAGVWDSDWTKTDDTPRSWGIAGGSYPGAARQELRRSCPNHRRSGRALLWTRGQHSDWVDEVVTEFVDDRRDRTGGHLGRHRLRMRSAAVIGRHDPAVVRRVLVRAGTEKPAQLAAQRYEEPAADAVGGSRVRQRRARAMLAGVPALGRLLPADGGQHPGASRRGQLGRLGRAVRLSLGIPH